MHTDSFEYSPCRRPDSWGYHRVGSCQAGFAGTISDDGRHFVLTAPGSFYWQGQVYSYSRNDTSYLPSYTAERDASDDDSYFGEHFNERQRKKETEKIKREDINFSR